MRSARLWARLLGVEQAVVERVCLDQDEQALVVSVRPRKGSRRRCGRCGRSRAFLRRFGLCRICFRQLSLEGMIPGVRKASW